jgi:23S rRNA pseudouridine2605 synthase
MFWVILIGKTPTAFHAKEREDLLPTLRQLQRTQEDVTLRWFERGKVWESPEAAIGAWKLAATEARERRTKEWRPGGEHRDPKARFEMTRDQKRAKFKRDQRGGGGSDEGGSESPFGPRVPRPRPEGRPEGRSEGRPFGDRPPRRDRPEAPPMENPFKERVRSERPLSDRPPTARPFGDRPFKPRTERSPFSRPASGRPPAGRDGGFKPPKRRS